MKRVGDTSETRRAKDGHHAKEVFLKCGITIAVLADERSKPTELPDSTSRRVLSITEIARKPENLAELLQLIQKGIISVKIVKELLSELLRNWL
eukprot:jgi/Chlat1/7222/Chrsp57S06761